MSTQFKQLKAWIKALDQQLVQAGKSHDAPGEIALCEMAAIQLGFNAPIERGFFEKAKAKVNATFRSRPTSISQNPLGSVRTSHPRTKTCDDRLRDMCTELAARYTGKKGERHIDQASQVPSACGTIRYVLERLNQTIPPKIGQIAGSTTPGSRAMSVGTRGTPKEAYEACRAVGAALCTCMTVLGMPIPATVAVYFGDEKKRKKWYAHFREIRKHHNNKNLNLEHVSGTQFRCKTTGTLYSAVYDKVSKTWTVT